MMDEEIAKNAVDFRRKLPSILTQNIAGVAEKSANALDQAYARLTCLQAIRSSLLEGEISPGAMGFFTEAQGDGLTSQVLIMSGSSRSAMKSLRSLIENVIRSVYYADHPVEYRLWEAGKHRPSFKELFDYLQSHPDLSDLDEKLQSAAPLYANWKKLSEYVHASAKDERMTHDSERITIWKTSLKNIGHWSTFQRALLRDVSLLYLALYKFRLQGAAQKSLRQSFGIAIPTKLDAKILADLQVKLPRK